MRKDAGLLLKRNMGTFGCLFIALGMLFVLAGCGHDDDDGAPPPTPIPALSGVVIDSAVSGLTYETATLEGTTDANGTFSYVANETVTFSIGDLELGSATGAQLLTPLSLVADAADATDQRVTNRLILLQVLDQDGDLNNGIQITQAIADIVSANAAAINFDQGTSETEFPASLSSLLTALNTAGAFTDTHRGARRFFDYSDPTKIATTARAHFTRSIGVRNAVATSQGTLSGFETNTNYWQYLGIRYGRPPIDELRWQPPQDPESWTGVRDAIAYGDQAPQAESYAIFNEGNVSEDCLVLNVTAPKSAANLPVMVWFHGGAFGILSGNALSYNNPLSVPSKGVILVTVNHRLGVFGYMAHPELTAASGYGGSGNYGQMDLIKALEWVHNNIAAFGGDPANVTIFGQSGGGGKAISLMASPLATDLFHKVICQSGMAPEDSETLNQSTLEGAEAKGTDLSTRLGGMTIAQMRALPFTDLLAADLAAYAETAWLRYGPNVDNHYLEATMSELLAAPMASDVPLLTGAMSADSVAGINLAPGVAYQMPLRAANSAADQYIYHWSYVPPGWEALGAGAYHGLELVYVFNYPASFISHHILGLNAPVTDEVIGVSTTTPPLYYYEVLGSTGYYDPFPVPSATSRALTDDVLTIWTNFAKNSNPSVDGVIAWPAYTGASGDGGNDAFVEIRSDETNGYEIEATTGVDAAFNPPL
jgi:para-nitrobenzyl esterase